MLFISNSMLPCRLCWRLVVSRLAWLVMNASQHANVFKRMLSWLICACVSVWVLSWPSFSVFEHYLGHPVVHHVFLAIFTVWCGLGIVWPTSRLDKWPKKVIFGCFKAKAFLQILRTLNLAFDLVFDVRLWIWEFLWVSTSMGNHPESYEP